MIQRKTAVCLLDRELSTQHLIADHW